MIDRDAYPGTISAAALALAQDAIRKSMSPEGIEASKLRAELCTMWGGGYRPHHIAINHDSCAEAMQAAELIVNAFVASRHHGIDRLFEYHPQPFSTNPSDAGQRGIYSLCDYHWSPSTRTFTFDLPDEWCDMGALKSIEKKLAKWQKNEKIEAADPDVTTLYVVAGAARSVGHHYMKAFQEYPRSFSIGIKRRGEDWMHNMGFEDMLHLNIGGDEDQEHIHGMLGAVVGHIPPAPLRIVLVYTIGPFEYQGHPELGDKAKIMPDSLYNLNYTAFRDVLGMIEDVACERRSYYGDKTRVDVVGLSTKALERQDSELFPVYAIAKKHMEEAIRDFGEKQGSGITRGGLVLRTSTLYTPSEGEMRAGAEKDVQKYWITPDELVAATAPAIYYMSPGYLCIDVFKENPNYSPAMHDRATARQKWQKELRTGEVTDTALDSGDHGLHTLWNTIRSRRAVPPPDGTISWSPDDTPPETPAPRKR